MVTERKGRAGDEVGDVAGDHDGCDDGDDFQDTPLGSENGKGQSSEEMCVHSIMQGLDS